MLRQGEKSDYSFFVEKGLMRQYSIDDKGKEHILQFASEGWFMADRESEFLGKPTSYFIEAMEDSIVFLINKELVSQLSLSSRTFMYFNNLLLHKHIFQLQKRITLLLSASAEERYLDFVKTYPDLMLGVPQVMVASYLGITSESLSRVRKALAQRNFRA